MAPTNTLALAADVEPPGVHAVTAQDGARLEFEIVGDDGPPIVMLHGSFTGRRAFSRQRDALVDAGYRLVLPSMRGHDGSEPDVPPGHGFDSTEVADLLTVLDAVKVDQARFVGHSTGGTIAFALARDHRERVERMALVEPTLVHLLRGEWLGRTLAEMERAVVAEQQEHGRVAMRATMDFIGGHRWHDLAPDAQETQLDAMAAVSHLASPHIDMLARFPVTDADVTALTVPTLFLYGGDSVPFEAEIAARLQTLRPDLPMVVVDGAGHNTHRDRADEVNRIILDFFV